MMMNFSDQIEIITFEIEINFSIRRKQKIQTRFSHIQQVMDEDETSEMIILWTPMKSIYIETLNMILSPLFFVKK